MQTGNTAKKNKVQALDRPMRITRFLDQFATKKETMRMSMREQAEWIEDQTAPTKGELPWLKLATFGHNKSKYGCYRTNVNLKEIDGIEGDYDGERVTLDQAVALVETAGFAAMFYPTARHMPEKPRWRVFCPLSESMLPDAREDFVARLNGALGGILAPESFTKSLSYYAGRVEGTEAFKTILVEGEFIDRVENVIPIYKKGDKTKPKRSKSMGETTGLPLHEFFDALMHIPNPDSADREFWFKIMCGVHHETNGGEDGLEMILEWSDLHPTHDYEKAVKAWESIGRAEDEATGATILWHARKHGHWHNFAEDQRLIDQCWTAEELEAKAAEALEAQTQADIEELVGPICKPENSELAARIEMGSPMLRDSGKPIINLHNTTLYLGRNVDTILPGLSRNLMTHRDEWRDGETTDAAISLARIALERKGLDTVGKELVSDAVQAVAQMRRYHPIRDYLNGLGWDGTPRIDAWLIQHAGAEDTPYTRVVSRKFPIAMVARVMEPGCKHDHTLVLSGPQGQNKSSACRILAGDRYFSDTMPAIHGDRKESMLHLQGKWLVELAELAPARKSDAEDLKAFLSGSIDKVRMPYAKYPESFHRQNVFVGTTNEDQFLRDATGGRRFWPIAVRQVIDIAALVAERDQFFAEAVEAFNHGEPWWLDREFEAEHAAPVQAAAYEEDSWAEEILGYLDNPQTEEGPSLETTIAQVLSDALYIQPGGQTQTAQKRAASVLRQIGWTKKKTKTGNVWRRPK